MHCLKTVLLGEFLFMKAILHNATRVIRRVSEEEMPQVAQDEIVVDLGDRKIDIAPKEYPDGMKVFWKLDLELNLVEASKEESEAARVDKAAELSKIKALEDSLMEALRAVAEDPLVVGSLKTYFIALKQFTEFTK